MTSNTRLTVSEAADSLPWADGVLAAVGYGRAARRELLVQQEAGTVPWERLHHRADRDLESLSRDELLTVLAWLWPVPSYGAFDGAVQNDAAVAQRRRIGALYDAWILQAADLTFRTPVALRAHVCWHARIGEDVLDRIIRGDARPNLRLILRLLYALRLHFVEHEGKWTLGPPSEIQAEVDRSMHRLGTLAELVRPEVSRARRVEASIREGDFYAAPANASRYYALYKYLRELDRDRISVRIDEIEAMVGPLPAAARASRSWWSGDGITTTKRPQVAAWWGAGLRVDRWSREEVEFVALPGRRDQFRRFGGLADDGFHVGAPETRAVAAATEPRPRVARDFDTALSQLLRVVGDGNCSRQEISAALNPNTPSEVRFDDGALSNLLTRARRAGLIVNHGSRRAPRWFVRGTMADRLEQVSEEMGCVLPAMSMIRDETRPSRAQDANHDRLTELRHDTDWRSGAEPRSTMGSEAARALFMELLHDTDWRSGAEPRSAAGSEAVRALSRAVDDDAVSEMLRRARKADQT